MKLNDNLLVKWLEIDYDSYCVSSGIFIHASTDITRAYPLISLQ